MRRVSRPVSERRGPAIGRPAHAVNRRLAPSASRDPVSLYAPGGTPLAGAFEDMSTLLADVRLAIRTLWKHPRAYAAAFLILTVGLAAATTMFNVVNAVLLEPLPFSHPDRLALVWDRTGDSDNNIWLSPPEFADLRQRVRAFDRISAMTDRRFTLTSRSGPEELQAAAVSPDFFDLIGVRARSGRVFRAGDDVHGAAPVALITEPLADRLFSGASAAIGGRVILDDRPWTVVGVLPRDFALWPPSSVFPKRVDVWVPIDAETYLRAGRNQNFLHAIARLREGIGLDAATSDLARVSEEMRANIPSSTRIDIGG